MAAIVKWKKEIFFHIGLLSAAKSATMILNSRWAIAMECKNDPEKDRIFE
jgi:hypothetical protein